ncbi:Tat proofreading chaperone TorD [Mesocricetibacter intestinalis]|uniref:Tat proofreading chaperone TorD n=1 Tax=Mesocricetibacter intestinalis TaxID=1521930 RepID=A0A4R6VB82_9PAST|nr:molecular chaperone TorD [Mesocricetibacter intestinalis]TDQ57391.1 Tat proofreading chaperone TorD [Mesocricetibacter intestinalis]
MEGLSIRERSFIYTWFVSLLGRELSESQLQQIKSGVFEPLFTFMQELGFQEKIQSLQQAFDACMALEYPHLELAADYAQLFLLEGELSALPYASAYLTEAETESHLKGLEHYLLKLELMPNREYHEPVDHLCIYLEVLIHLLERDEQEARRFAEDYIFSWLPTLVGKLNEKKRKNSFYALLVNLLFDFIRRDLS